MGTTLELKKNEIKEILYKMIIADNVNLLEHLTTKNIIRVNDFYKGFCISFNNFSEPPYEEHELKNFIYNSLYNFFKDLTK